MNDMNPIDAGQGELSNGQPTSSSAPEALTPSSATTPPAAQTAAEQLYDVKIGGQTRKVPLNELLSGYSRNQDYTQKTMALAEERRALQAQFDSERQQVREFLTKRENVQQLLSYLETQNPTAQPGQPLTPQHLQAALEAERQRQAQAQQAMFQEIENRQTTASYRADIDSHVKGLLEQHPQLKVIRGIERILKTSAAEQDPQDLDEAKSYIAQAAQEQLDAINTHFTEQQKQAVLAKQSLTQKGTEPPGGAPPMPQAKPNGRIGSPEFNSSMAAMLEQMSANAR